jgi:hypothetical protein
VWPAPEWNFLTLMQRWSGAAMCPTSHDGLSVKADVQTVIQGGLLFLQASTFGGSRSQPLSRIRDWREQPHLRRIGNAAYGNVTAVLNPRNDASDRVRRIGGRPKKRHTRDFRLSPRASTSDRCGPTAARVLSLYGVLLVKRKFRQALIYPFVQSLCWGALPFHSWHGSALAWPR